jgi:hypothetical protein
MKATSVRKVGTGMFYFFPALQEYTEAYFGFFHRVRDLPIGLSPFPSEP